MALTANKTCIAAIAQAAVDTFLDPTANLMPCANLSLNIGTQTVENPEYTGSVEKNSPFVIGSTVELSFDLMMRGPGGADVPAAGAYLPGMFLIGSKMTESRVTSAVPASPEALSSGTTSGFTGGAGMTATADLYKGMLVDLAGQGAKPKSLVPVATNTAGKVASLMRTYGAPVSGNYQFPKQLNYHGSISATEPMPLSLYVWIDGVRYGLVNAAVSGLQYVVPTAVRNGSPTPPMFKVTLKARLYSKGDNATPTIPSLGQPPIFRDGLHYLNGVAIGAANFTVNRNIQTDAGPNANQSDGSDYDQIVEIVSSVELELQSYRVATMDLKALADAQTEVSYFALWGSASGKTVCINVPKCRLTYGSPSLGGGLVTESPQLLIDVYDRAMSVNFPYW